MAVGWKGVVGERQAEEDELHIYVAELRQLLDSHVGKCDNSNASPCAKHDAGA